MPLLNRSLLVAAATLSAALVSAAPLLTDEKLGDLVRSGPTQTNVNDFRAILIDPA